MSRRCWLSLVVAGACLIQAAVLASAASAWPAAQAGSRGGVSFIHISDTHVSDLTGVHPKLQEWRGQNRGAALRLTDFLQKTVRDQAPAFVVASGDLIDAYCFDGASASRPVYGQIELFRSIVRNSPVPFYPAPGNHDIECYRYTEGSTEAKGDQSVKTEARRAWRERLDAFRHGTYYKFRKQVGAAWYSFLILDNGETGEHRDPEYREQQMAWVKKEAEAHPNDHLIFLMHIPLRDDAFTESLRSAIGGAGRSVLALAGHNHRDVLDEVPFGARPLQQVRTASLAAGADNWRTVRLLEDRIEVTATGNPLRILITIELPIRS